MAVAKLTKRVVDSLEAPENGERWVWDTDAKGLGLKVTPAGRKGFFLKYRPAGQRTTRKLTLGTYGVLTVEQARDEARKALGAIVAGSDPARERADRRRAPTVAEALDQYLTDHQGHWRPRTAAEYRRQADHIIAPAIGTLKVRDVARDDVAGVLRRLKDRPILTNRVLALASAFMTWAIRAGLRPSGLNPAKYLSRHKEKGRTRFLTGEEIGRLGVALKAAETGAWADKDGKPLPPAPWQSVAAIKLLALTGCRRSEILDLRWSEVELDRGQLLLRDTKSGESNRPLNAQARAVLETLPKGDPTARVLAGAKGRRHEIKYAWAEIRRVAKLPDVRLHDLRHTLASRSQHSGHSLLVTAALLGHRNLATTQKYAHLIADPLREAADRVGGEIGALLDGRQTPVVPLARRKARR